MRKANTAPKWRRSGLDLALGESVYNAADPRHIGTVEAIRHSAVAKVRWLKTGWVSYVTIPDLRFAALEDMT